MYDGYEMFVLSSRLQETTVYTVRKERGNSYLMFDGYEMFVLSSRLRETTVYTVRKCK